MRWKVLTPAVNIVIDGNIQICNMLEEIHAYHKRLGFPKEVALLEDRISEHREICLGLMAECAEVLNAAPWKRWKDYSKAYKDAGTTLYTLAVKNHIAEELVDVLFFMSSIMEVWDITPRQFAEAFQLKLAENENRLNNGYNARPTEER